MDDDPDDLAAAFSAQQAAKEKAKATLPTEDWVRAIDASFAAFGNNERKDSGDAAGASKSWLVTNMPPAPTRDKDGIIGIRLDPSCDSCCSTSGKKQLTAAEKEIRSRIKESLVQRLEEEMNKL
mmetsp:Transcript_26209/g.44698  ORF Transcript_26209/g.44698 Transcript_26209/m.44698 type:complete len:124 (-) Transcript_26209:328-699(-)